MDPKRRPADIPATLPHHDVPQTTAPQDASRTVDPHDPESPTAGKTDAAVRIGNECCPRQIGRYDIRREIARGGMGAILQAWDPSLQRWLAVKVGLARRGPEVHARFLTEARITGKLAHPGIPPVHELGALDDGRPFFAMKLIEGETLSFLLQQRRNPEDELPKFLGIFAQVCETVAFVHSRGVVHRDLKPINIMVGAFGEVQVMDWGLAKELEAAAPAADEPVLAGKNEEDDSTQGPFVTVQGAIMGTPSYMAPEQARGDIDRIDRRSDVFGLGAILCEILTGRPPFTGTTASEVLSAATRADWSETRRVLEAASVERPLVELTTRCLAVEPGERLADAGEVAGAVGRYQRDVADRLKQADLARARAEVEYAAERKRRALERHRTRLWFGLGLAATLLLVGALGVFAGYQRMRASRIAEQVRAEEQRAARRGRMDAEVTDSLSEAELAHQELLGRLRAPREANRLLSSLHEWEVLVADAEAALERAERVARADLELVPAATRERLAHVRDVVDQDRSNLDTVRRLDACRLARFQPSRVRAYEITAAEFQEVFTDLGFDLDQLQPDTYEEFAARINASDIRAALIAALDEWSTLVQATEDNGYLKLRLIGVTACADPDPWRIRWRHPIRQRDKAEVEKLIQEMDLEDESPAIITHVVQIMRLHGMDPIPLLRRALFYNPDDFFLNNSMGHAETDLQARLHAYRTLTAIRPRNAIAWGNVGAVLSAMDDQTNARLALERAVELDPEFGDAWNNLGSLYKEIGEIPQAIRAFERSRDLSGGENHLVWHNLATVHLLTDDYEEALEASQKAVTLAESGSITKHMSLESVPHSRCVVYRTLGQAQLGLERWSDAKEAFEKAIGYQEVDAASWYLLGVAHKKLGAYPETIRAWERSYELVPEDASTLYELGEVHLTLGNRQAAEDSFRQFYARTKKRLADEPQSGALQDDLASVVEKLGNLAIGRGDFAVARDLFTEYRYVVAERARRHPEQLAPQRKLVQAWGRLGDLSGKLEDNQAALDAYKQERAVLEPLVEAHPDDAWFLQMHMACLSRIGRFQRKRADFTASRAAYRQALQLVERAREEGRLTDQLDSFAAMLNGGLRTTQLTEMALGDLQDVLGKTPELVPELLQLRADHLGEQGRPFQAAEAATRLAQLPDPNPEQLVSAAGLLAMCAGVLDAGRDEPSKEQTDQLSDWIELALSTLGRAIEAGWNDPQRLREDPAFDILRDKPEFRKWLDQDMPDD